MSVGERTGEGEAGTGRKECDLTASEIVTSASTANIDLRMRPGDLKNIDIVVRVDSGEVVLSVEAKAEDSDDRAGTLLAFGRKEATAVGEELIEGAESLKNTQ